MRQASHAGEVPLLHRDLLVGPNAQAASPELATSVAVLDPVAALEGLPRSIFNHLLQMPRLRSVLAQGLAAIERVDVHLDLNGTCLSRPNIGTV